MRKLLIVGAYGTGNAGDEALLSGILHLIKGRTLYDYGEKGEVVIFSRDPAETTRFHGITARRKNLADFLTANAIIFGGGELFQDRGYMALKYSALTICAKLLRKRVTYVSLGVSKITCHVGKLLTKISFCFADDVSVRGEESRNNLKELGVHRQIPIEPDLSFHVVPVPPRHALNILKGEGIEVDSNTLIGVVFQYVPPSQPNHQILNKKVERLFTGLSKKILDDSSAQIVFIPFNQHKGKPHDNDILYGAKLAKTMGTRKYTVINRIYGPEELKGIISLFDLIISTRLHPIIFAYTNGVPCICVEVFEKVTAFCREHGIPTVKLNELEKTYILAKRIIEQRPIMQHKNDGKT